MAQIEMPVTLRGANNKRVNRRARRDGRLPAVVYGEKKDPQPIMIDGHVFYKMRNKISSSTIFNLKNEGQLLAQTLVRDVQVDPVTEIPVHVDFLRINAEHPVTVQVGIHGVGGVPIGVRQGGVLEHSTREVEIRCLPLEVPDAFEVDISKMEMGDSFHVGDLQLPAGVEMLTAGDTPLFTVVATRLTTETEEAEEGAEGAEMAEGEAEEDEGGEEESGEE